MDLQKTVRSIEQEFLDEIDSPQSRASYANVLGEITTRVWLAALDEASKAVECFSDEVCGLTRMKCANHKAVEDLKV